MAALHQSQLTLPPSLDLALLSTPPSSEALRHSGGDNLLWTSAMVTLYLLVEDSSDSRPGVEQKMSVGRRLTAEGGAGAGRGWCAAGGQYKLEAASFFTPNCAEAAEAAAKLSSGPGL